MAEKGMNVGELAAVAGVSRRAVRFYVTRGLLRPPEGRARAGYYTPNHLEQLLRIQELQSSGHSLEAIRKIMAGEAMPDAPPRPVSRARPGIQASLWTRVVLQPGVEMHFDATSNIQAEQIIAVKAAVQAILGCEPAGTRNAEEKREPH